MGRKLEFSKEKALHTAMEEFWAQGYVATSMRDLAQKLGLHLGSVYNALGDKEHVFQSALKLNLEQYMMPRLRKMCDEKDAIAALDAYMSEVVDECTSGRPSHGCFLVNSLLEISNINPDVTQLLGSYIEQMEDAFVCCIRKAQLSGQIPAAKSAQEQAQFIMGAIFSMRAMAKLKTPRTFIDSMRICAMKGLVA